MEHATLGRTVEFEHPLNERVRKLMRLEFLLAQTRHHLSGRSGWDTRAAIGSMLETLEGLGRSDIKGELIQEMDRQRGHLEQLRHRAGIDQEELNKLLGELRDLTDQLHTLPGQPGQILRENELISSFRQRMTIPGGTAYFDLPGLHRWLNQPLHQRQETLSGWYSQFTLLEQCLDMVLRLIRETGKRTLEVARGGIYEQVPDAERPCQLLRIALPVDCGAYPEISAGRHRITIRFVTQVSLEQRPCQVTDDLEFRLACCRGAT
ncbi:MAG: cell division protein ZapD [Pseudomonadota bacterium]|nr:cell division protein ZapD [Pseudomonadota bacterium]